MLLIVQFSLSFIFPCDDSGIRRFTGDRLQRKVEGITRLIDERLQRRGIHRTDVQRELILGVVVSHFTQFDRRERLLDLLQCVQLKKDPFLLFLDVLPEVILQVGGLAQRGELVLGQFPLLLRGQV